MRGTDGDDPTPARAPAEADALERDRRALHLKTLYDTARELSQLSDPQRVLDTFLLMTMGPLGMRLGVAQLFDLGGEEAPLLAARGLEDAGVDALRAAAPETEQSLFGPSCDNVLGRVEIVTTNLAGYPFLPQGAQVLVRWCGPDRYAGYLVLGNSLGDEPRGPEDEEYISRLAGILITSLRHAVAVQTINHLNEDLGAKNEALERAVATADAMQKELDRRMFQLNSLYEATQELSGIVEPRGLLDAFLLTVMGVFGSREGGVYLHGGDTPALVLRGAGAVPGSVDEIEAVQQGLAAYFAEAPDDDAAMTMQLLTGEKQLEGAPFPFPVQVAVAFVVDGDLRGLLALGERLGDEPYRMADHKLLKAHVGNVLSYIKNARDFDQINALNRDLTERNEELNRLLEEISECKIELDDVAQARERILSVIRRETSRSGRVRRMDFVLILVLSLVIGLVFNFSNPAGVPLIPDAWRRPPLETIDAEWLRLRVESESTLVVDARPAPLYRKAHIRDAVNLPRALFDFVYAMRFSNLPPDTNIVVYGRTISSHYDEDVASMLRERGFSKVMVLEDGLEAWRERGYPVEY